MQLSRSNRAVAAIAVGVALTVVWSVTRDAEPAPEKVESARPAAVSTTPAPVAAPKRPSGVRPRSPAAPDAALPPAATLDEDEHVEPHPVSAERLAMVPPWGTVEDVRAAHKAGDFERARAILRERERADPKREEWRDFYAGLELIGDCLQAPSEATLKRAQAFIVEYRASPMRRHVRRACGVKSQ